MTSTQRNLLIAGGILVVVVGFLWSGYNGLVSGQEQVKNAWADVQTQYQRRLDLIDNVVETAKGAAKFEKETLRMVVEARSAWARATGRATLNDQVAAAQEAAPLMSSALSRLLVTVEAYPQLQSVQAFRDVITELEGTENRIAVARRDYNAAVKVFNVRVRQFPGNITAQLFGFSTTQSFEADAGAKEAPKVDFGTKE